MKVHQIRIREEIAAPPTAVWDRVQEHDQTHTWVKEARVQVVKEGRPRNGVGAERRVSFPSRRFWTPILERVLVYDAPRELHYKIVEGMPGLADHLGKFIIDDLGPNRSALRWEIDLAFKPWHPMAWYAPFFVKTFKGVVGGAVLELKRQLEGR